MAETTILGRSHRDLARVLEVKSTTMLSNFYDRFSEAYGVPILVDKDFELKMNDTIVKGNIPIIRETPDKVIEMLHLYVDTTYASRSILPLAIKYNISTVISTFAFEKIYGTMVQNTCYGVMTGKSLSLNIDPSHFNKLSSMVTQISTAIQNNLFYPVMNNNCINCSYNKICARN